MNLEQKLHTCEAQNQTLKSEKSKLNAEFKLCKANLEVRENEEYEKEAEKKVIIGSLTQQTEKLTREKKNLEIQLDAEKSKLEAESKKLQVLLADLAREKESQQKLVETRNSFTREKSSDETGLGNSPNLKRISSGSSSSLLLERRGSGMEYINTSPQQGNINVLDQLQSRLKQKDGEISQLQVRLFYLRI